MPIPLSPAWSVLAVGFFLSLGLLLPQGHKRWGPLVLVLLGGAVVAVLGQGMRPSLAAGLALALSAPAAWIMTSRYLGLFLLLVAAQPWSLCWTAPTGVPSAPEHISLETGEGRADLVQDLCVHPVTVDEAERWARNQGLAPAVALQGTQSWGDSDTGSWLTRTAGTTTTCVHKVRRLRG